MQVTGRGFNQTGPFNPRNGLGRKFPHGTLREMEAQKGDVTYPAGLVTEQEWLTVGKGVLPR